MSLDNLHLYLTLQIHYGLVPSAAVSCYPGDNLHRAGPDHVPSDSFRYYTSTGMEINDGCYVSLVCLVTCRALELTFVIECQDCGLCPKCALSSSHYFVDIL